MPQTLSFREGYPNSCLRPSVGLDTVLLHISAVAAASAGGIVPALLAVVTSFKSREILASGKLSDLFEEKKREHAIPRGPPLGFRERSLYFLLASRLTRGWAGFTKSEGKACLLSLIARGEIQNVVISIWKASTES